MQVSSGNKRKIVLVVILTLTGLCLFFLISKEHASEYPSVIAYVNGKPIKNLDYQLRLRDASSATPGRDVEYLKKQVLEDMINAELLYQEAIRRYGKMPRRAAILKIMQTEVKFPCV